MFSDASRRIESGLFHLLFPIRIKDSNERSVLKKYVRWVVQVTSFIGWVALGIFS